jgi:bla regulator protein BlaR1
MVALKHDSGIRSSIVRGAALATLLLSTASLSAGAQGAAPAAIKTPVYDVATIKPNNKDSHSTSVSINDGTLNATNVSIRILLDQAFNIKQSLIFGLPGWALSARYDVVAKAVDAAPADLENLTKDQRRTMLRELLIERLHLQTHIEVKTLPVYDLEIAKGGVLFKPSVVDEGKPGDNENMNISNQDMVAKQCTMLSLAGMLADQVERKVIDKTGLTGHYDLHLRWQREDAPHPDNGADELPTIFTAVQEQLGLKLEADKGPVDTLVIDHIEVPTEN